MQHCILNCSVTIFLTVNIHFEQWSEVKYVHLLSCVTEVLLFLHS